MRRVPVVVVMMIANKIPSAEGLPLILKFFSNALVLCAVSSYEIFSSVEEYHDMTSASSWATILQAEENDSKL